MEDLRHEQGIPGRINQRGNATFVSVGGFPMLNWGHWSFVLAVDAEKVQEGGNFFEVMFVPMLLIAVLWYFLLLRPQSRERRKHEDILKALKKNDRVVTIGGIIGAVANVSADGTEVTLKVDDNTRIKFRRSSIQSVLKDDSESAKPDTQDRNQ